MYKVHHKHNNADICWPDTLEKDLPHVIEIGHSFPPHGYETKQMHRKCYVLHYIVSGKGLYFDQPVEGPCAFMLTPNNLQYYKADDSPDSPAWEQYWIMFSGPGIEQMLKMANLPQKPICFPCPYIEEAIEILKRLQEGQNYANQSDYLYMMTGLFQLFSLHATTKQTSENQSSDVDKYVQLICNYIHQNYANIKEENELAQLINFSTNYMRRIFKKKMGTTPIRYLINYRIHCAKKFLRTQDLPIYVVSEIVGFSNPNYFCLVFKKYCNGLSPQAYRMQHRQSQY